MAFHQRITPGPRSESCWDCRSAHALAGIEHQAGFVAVDGQAM
jgi:hypothetical protein